MSKKINISKYSTKAPKNIDKEQIKLESQDLRREVGELMVRMHAEGKQSLLIVVQGMDASGKDGVTKKLLRYCPPIISKVTSFKKPTDYEMMHDFLWRVHKVVPAKGEVGVFVRSHYEDVLIQRVRGWIDKDTAKARFDAINNFERNLEVHNNTKVVKLFMNISPERQEEKLQERIDILEKNWKHNDGDWEERKLWKNYMSAYTDVLNKCNDIPWYIVPCDQRWYRNYIALTIVRDALVQMNCQYPTIS